MIGSASAVRTLAVALAGLLACAVALWHLEDATAGLVVTRAHVGPAPVTVFRPAAAADPLPAVVIAHGFAGSQQLMLPFATTLARNGLVAVTFDFPGHGRNAAPLRGGIADSKASGDDLLAALADGIAFARSLPGVDRRVALLGHSMGSDIVVRRAVDDPEIAATVAVSLFSTGVITAERPRNLLVIDGALEPALLLDEGRRILAMAEGASAQPETTYGRVADGTARRLVLAPGVEHIGVLYSGTGLAETAAWLGLVFGNDAAAAVDRRAPWLGLLYAGLMALGWALCRALPAPRRDAAPPAAPRLPWGRLLLATTLPAVATPLVLSVVPTRFLPILMADYLTLHFGLYGLATAACLWRVKPAAAALPPGGQGRIAAAAALLTLFELASIGLPIDAYVTAFVPGGARLPSTAAILAGTLAYCLADAWLGARAARRGVGIATKLCFLLSLAGAVALDPPRLFFLAIIVPAIVLFFVLSGLLAGWAYRRTGAPVVGAVVAAALFAWAIGAIFPLVG